MQETKPAPVAYAAPAPMIGNSGQYIQETPKWVFVVRVLQALFSFIILACAGYLIHGHAMDANVFALVVCLMTWVVVAYAVVTEKFTGAHGLYNIWAVLSLDLAMAIFWLSSLGANAAQRAAFKYDVDVLGCYDDGSSVSAHTCVVAKRSLEKRAAVAGSVGLAVMSAIAGLSALMMIFFIATLVWHGHTFRIYHQGKTPAPAYNANVEMTAQQQTPAAALYPTNNGYPSQPQPQQQAYQGQPQQQQQGYPQHPPQPSVSPVYSASAQSTPYQPPQPLQQKQQGYPQHPPPQPSVSPVYSNPSTPYTQQNAPPLPVPTPSPAYELPNGQPQNGPYQLPGQNTYPQQQQQQAGPYQLAGSQPYNNQQQYQQYPPQASPQGTPAPGQPYYPPAH